jgi:hypothetical protein
MKGDVRSDLPSDRFCQCFSGVPIARLISLSKFDDIQMRSPIYLVLGQHDWKKGPSGTTTEMFNIFQIGCDDVMLL